MFAKELPPDNAIAALLPEYTPEGDATRVLLTDGSAFLYPRTLRATLRTLARRRCKDLSLLRRWASRYTRRRLNNPIAASAELVLVPVKTRVPRVAGDETMGAVNVAALPEPREWDAAPRGPRRRGAVKAQPAPKAAPRAIVAAFGGQPSPCSLSRTLIPLAGGGSVASLWSEETTLAHLAAARHISVELAREEEEAVLRRLVAPKV